MNKYVKALVDPEFRFSILAARNFYNNMPDEKFLIKRYKLSYGKAPDLKEPRDFNEKILWLKLHDRREEYARFADKMGLREYIRDKLGEDRTVPLAGGPWKSFEEIDFSSLPEKFVLKCTHDSGSVIVCRDKNSFDIAAARARLERRLKRNWYYGNREWQYKNIEPGIIAEEYIDTDGELFEYKMMCFNGKMKMLFLSSGIIDKEGHATAESYSTLYGRDYERLPVKETLDNCPNPPEKPENWEEMVAVAEKLAEGFPLLRVDMYNVGGRILIGELTLHHNAGLDNIFDPPEWAEIMGSWIELPEKKM